MMIQSIKCLAIILMILFIAACSRKPVEFAPLVPLEPTLTVNTLWSSSVGGINKKKYLKLTPTVYMGNVYTAASNGQVTAINAQTGQHVWSVNIKESISTGVGIDDAMLYIGTQNAEVVALNRHNGAVVWRTPVSNEVLAKPNAVASTLLVKTINDHVYALNKQNGQVVWSYTQPAPKMTLRGGSSPLVANGLIVVGFADGSVGVLDDKNGSIHWSSAVARPNGGTAIEQMVDIDDSMAVADGVIYVASYQGTMAALSLQTGDLFWERNLSSYAGLALDDHNVYVTAANGDVLAFNRKTGNLIWTQDQLTHRGVTGPVVVGNRIVVADKEGFVHWISAANGSFVARTLADGKGVIANPVTDGHAVYIYTNSGKLIKYSSSR